MAHDHSHSHANCGRDVEALKAKARDALIAAGEQWTAMREAVFVELARYDSPVSAYQIADDLSQTRGKRVAPNSVYRILDVFVAKNLTVKIESANAFLANSHPGEEHDCVFLVCDTCGTASHVDSETVGQNLRDIASSQNFRADRPILEIRGKCSDCR
ncbi:transcriptional repressor [Erythrobacter sp. SCSIO 43205]|uniref:Fur family transcriptional regulator n=1 Tax=Erythrobacter sp. SCSIO 43205 TaxID=2779361 RepID=UPI001CA9354C|nr:transcriptional repressor [Erythrobacter sp. SCSIO 43205]UAB78537.1 transcriptional repressor [Erythrobacter sp. SCSIO 43205]